MLKAYSIGFFGAVLVVALAAAVWLATHPEPEPGLVWGNTTYTSKAQFDGYLKSRGLSYKTWLKRNPGAAPWEPALPEASMAASRTETGSRRTTRQVVEDWTTGLPLTPLAAIVVAGGALVLLRRIPRPGLTRAPARQVTLSAYIPRYTHLFKRVVQTDAKLVPKLMRDRNINTGDLAFCLLGIASVGLFLLFVGALLAA